MTCVVFFLTNSGQEAAYRAYWITRSCNGNRQPFMGQILSDPPINDRNRHPKKGPGYLIFEVAQNGHFLAFEDPTVQEIMLLDLTPLSTVMKLRRRGKGYLRTRRILAHQRTRLSQLCGGLKS